MFKETATDLYLHTPLAWRPALRKWYHVLNPTLSWRSRKRSLEATREFSDRFFGSEERLAEYEAEFNESCVGPAIHEAMAQLPEDVSLFDAHKDECVRLYALVRETEPETVVETGVYSGVSTISILAALAANGSGRLYSIDYSDALREAGTVDPLTEQGFARGRPSCAEEGTHLVPPGKEPGWVIPDHLCERWEYVPGKPQLELPALLSRLGEIDLFHHDSSHEMSSMLFEFELAWQYLHPGGVLVSNHIGWNDAFRTFVEGHSSDYGLMTWHYNAQLDYDRPGSSGYIVKSSDAGGDVPPQQRGGLLAAADRLLHPTHSPRPTE